MKKLLYIFILVLVLSSCDNHRKSSTEGNSVYYWKTTFSLDKTKQDFISKNNITRLYIRYFDVVLRGNASVPNATIKFKSSIPDSIQVIPAIYIMNECMQSRDTSLAEKILERILQINATNDIKNVREIQIDCDYTKKTEHNFLAFMQQLYNLCNKHKIGLATTVRLYQLSWQEPKADRGVLMMYNTGDFTQLSCEHPILDMRDVKPYLPALRRYKLPLSTAYPLYRWKIVFRNGRYIGILHTDDELPVLPGDSIAMRQPELSEILEAKEAVSKQQARANDEVILFDLNNSNITRFKYTDYEEILNH